MEYDISVIIPAYNAEKYIKRAIESVLQQEEVTLQIILVENGSIDTTAVVCDKYAQRFPNVECYHLKEGNVSRARNEGLEHVKGRYISFVDADDYIEKGVYAELLKKNEGADIVLFDYYKCTKGETVPGDSITVGTGGEALELDAHQVKYTFVGPVDSTQSAILAAVWRGIYKRDFWEKNKIYFNPELQIGEDLIFLIQILSLCESVKYVKEKFYYYTVYGNSVTSDFQRNSWKKYEKLFYALIDEIEKENEISKCKKRIFVKLCGITKWLVAETAKSSTDWKTKREQINNIYVSFEEIRRKIACENEKLPSGIYNWIFEKKYKNIIILLGKLLKIKSSIHASGKATI